MQFWCAANGAAWTWTWRPYPGVWLFVVLLALAVFRWNRAGTRRTFAATTPTHPLFFGGLIVLWLALDWPIGALGAGYLASVHMLQFLMVALIAPPLLLRGIQPSALAMLGGEGWRARVFARLTSPLLALSIFSATVLLTHLPAVVDGLMTSQIGSFVIDVLWLAAGLLFWWPVVLPCPEHPKFQAPLKMGYLVLGMMFSPVMFGLVGFLVYASTPLYGVFELAPPLPGVSSQSDHQTAGALMSVGGALISFIGISVIFFRWSKDTA
ncbi:MAG: cytochrome c oxidase assembly protein [Gemmatimonadaceae bacterium]